MDYSNNPFEVINQRLSKIEGLLLDIKSPLPISPVKPESDYLPRKATCQRMGGISLPTLNEYTKRGLIKGYRIGRRVLYKPSDIDAAMTAIRTKKGGCND